MGRRGARPELLLLVLAACQLATEGGTQDPTSGTTVVPSATGAGIPQGSRAAVIIGAGGGELSAANGAVRLTVPAGSVASPTEFRVTPISSTAPGAVGVSFRIEAGQPFSGQVQVTFTGVSAYRNGLGASALTIRSQDARGFWVAPDSVFHDVAADTLTAFTPHLSDWALVLSGTPALEGTFTLTQTAFPANPFAGVAFSAAGTAALYELPAMGEPTYLLTGTVTLPATLTSGTLTCVPDAQTKNLVLSVAEIPAAVFRWGINANWGLTCTDSVGGAVSSRELATIFDTLSINDLPCGGGYVGTQVNGSGYIQGGYTTDCGAAGSVSATWDFRACAAGGACVPADPCLTGTVTCSLGIGSCTPGPIAPVGTPCGTSLVCDAAGACVACVDGGGCTPSNPCLAAGSGTLSCSGWPTCGGGTPVAAGAACDAAGAPGTCDGAGVCTPL